MLITDPPQFYIFFFFNLTSDMVHVTCHMWHGTCEKWHVTGDTWHVAQCGAWQLSQNFKSLAQIERVLSSCGVPPGNVCYQQGYPPPPTLPLVDDIIFEWTLKVKAVLPQYIVVDFHWRRFATHRAPLSTFSFIKSIFPFISNAIYYFVALWKLLSRHPQRLIIGVILFSKNLSCVRRGVWCVMHDKHCVMFNATWNTKCANNVGMVLTH